MQRREAVMPARSPLEALLARGDDDAFDYLADCLTGRREIKPDEAPPLAPFAGDDRDRPKRDLAEVEG
jgi:hypothetical protein